MKLAYHEANYFCHCKTKAITAHTYNFDFYLFAYWKDGIIFAMIEFMSKISIGIEFMCKFSIGIEFVSKISIRIAFMSKISIGLEFMSEISIGIEFMSKISIDTMIMIMNVWAIHANLSYCFCQQCYLDEVSAAG